MRATQTDLPEHIDPLAPVSAAWLWLFALAWLGFWLLVMLPTTVMLAQLARDINEDDKVRCAPTTSRPADWT